MKLNQWTVTFIGTCVVGLLSGTNSWRPDKPGTEWPPDLPSWPMGKPIPDRHGFPALAKWNDTPHCYQCDTRKDGPDCLSTDPKVLQKFAKICYYSNNPIFRNLAYCETWSNTTSSIDGTSTLVGAVKVEWETPIWFSTVSSIKFVSVFLWFTTWAKAGQDWSSSCNMILCVA